MADRTIVTQDGQGNVISTTTVPIPASVTNEEDLNTKLDAAIAQLAALRDRARTVKQNAGAGFTNAQRDAAINELADVMLEAMRIQLTEVRSLRRDFASAAPSGG
jgi:hypothetical protein